MTVSIRSVLHNTQFKRADPVVEVEGKDLDMPVRWVFTNEREDVSSFLSGGEMLIIEGNALLAADWHGTLGQYVASLAQAGVAALVVELVEGVVRMPDELVSAARLHGLTLIGLKSRVPLSTSVRVSIPLSCTNRCTCNWRWTQCPLHYVRDCPVLAISRLWPKPLRRCSAKASPFSMVTVCWPLERVVRSMPATNRAPSSPLKVAPGRWEH